MTKITIFSPQRKDERNSAGNIDTKEIFTRRKFRRTQCPQHEAPCSGRNKRGWRVDSSPLKPSGYFMYHRI